MAQGVLWMTIIIVGLLTLGIRLSHLLRTTSEDL